ncbi:hypothetical protein NQ315_011998 [Exocentrus adspersus]|uniref:DUF7043 domain-containing protein n=1 Tax=Exocentrus adspersus TaxID=1586481 RepID=A0AAV8W339_9CUCU|nr:hypothetical protein NQ315_011998 [Exocentrus adspersus]
MELRVGGFAMKHFNLLCIQDSRIKGNYDLIQNGYNCMSFYRRDAHVIEVQIGSHTKRREDACSATFFDRNKLPFVTLVNSDLQACYT